MSILLERDMNGPMLSTCGWHTNEMQGEERSRNREESWLTFEAIRFRSRNGRRPMIVCEVGVE